MGLNYPKSMGVEWIKLKEDVKNAFTAANSRQPYQKIGAGILTVASSLTVLAGGFIKFIWSTGSTGLYMGRFTILGEPHDGLLLYQQSGGFAFSSYNKVSDGSGFTAIYDGTHNIVVSDDAVATKGLARPWLPHTFENTVDIAVPPSSRQTSSTSDTAVVSTITFVQHPKLEVWFYTYIQTPGASVEVKLKDLTTSETLFAQTYTSSGYQVALFSLGTWNFGDSHQFDFTIRRSAGSGNVGLTVLSMFGRQS